MKDTTISASLLGVTTSISVFVSLLPDLGDVRKARGEPDLTNDVRLGEIAATGLVLATGFAASAMVESPVPGVLSVIASVGLILMYESILTAPPKEKVAT